jgi:hypothetical protein
VSGVDCEPTELAWRLVIKGTERFLKEDGLALVIEESHRLRC